MALDLPIKNQTNDSRVVSFFDNYWQKKVEYAANDFDAVVGFFTKRNFDQQAAIAIAQLLITQAKIDQIPVFKLIDTLKSLPDVKLSNVVTEILNFNRDKTSRLGYSVSPVQNKFESRNIMI
tara:strand:- start:365 stop:730 length:366 start_codon:yes stop_codon:yes gene_type:complete